MSDHLVDRATCTCNRVAPFPGSPKNADEHWLNCPLASPRTYDYIFDHAEAVCPRCFNDTKDLTEPELNAIKALPQIDWPVVQCLRCGYLGKNTYRETRRDPTVP